MAHNISLPGKQFELNF